MKKMMKVKKMIMNKKKKRSVGEKICNKAMKKFNKLKIYNRLIN